LSVNEALEVGNKYSMYDIFCDVINFYDWSCDMGKTI